MSKTVKQVVDEICCDTCNAPCETYCTAKQIISWFLKQSQRNLVQIKCIEKYKYERSYELKKDIGWNDAAIEWADLYGESFAKVYSDDLSYSEIYKLTLKNK